MDAHKNFAYATLASNLTTGATSASLSAGHGSRLPTPPFNITLRPFGATLADQVTKAEIARVTGQIGDVLTLIRGQEGTSALSFVAGDELVASITAKTITDIEAVAGTPGPPGPAIASSSRKYALLDGTANRGYTTPDQAGLRLTTAIRFFALIKPTQINSGNNVIIVSKWSTTGTPGNRGYDWGIKSDGSLQVNFSTTGGDSVTINSSIPLSSVVEGTEPVLVQIDLIANNGAGQSQATFSYSTDWGQTAFKQLGSVVTNATPGPFFASTANIFIGGTANGSFLYNGRFYWAEIWDISSTPTIVARMDARGLATSASDYSDTVNGGRTWTHQSAAQIFSDEVNGLDMLNGSIPPERLGEVLTDGLTIISSGGKGRWAAPAGQIPGIAMLTDFTGADRTGTTDSTAAILAACAAVTPTTYHSVSPGYEFGAGTVFVPPGLYKFSSLVQIPDHVCLVGYGMRNTIFICTAAGARLNWGVDSPYAATSYRAGHNGNFFVDGNGISTLVFSLGNVTQGSWSDIEIRNSAGDGARFAAGQNNLIEQFQSEFNAGNGLVVDAGWGGNQHTRMELNQNGSLGAGYYNFKQINSLAGPNYNEPSDNKFEKGMWERWGQSGAGGNVYIGAGYNNVFDAINFAAGNVTGSKPVITLRADLLNGSTRNSILRFINCHCQGTKGSPGTGTTFLDAQGSAVQAAFIGRTFPTIHDVVWKIDDNAVIFVDEGTGGNNTTYNTLFANQGGGTKTMPEVVRQRGRPAAVNGVPTDTSVQTFWGRFPQDTDMAYNVNDPTKLYVRMGGSWKSATYA